MLLLLLTLIFGGSMHSTETTQKPSDPSYEAAVRVFASDPQAVAEFNSLPPIEGKAQVEGALLDALEQPTPEGAREVLSVLDDVLGSIGKPAMQRAVRALALDLRQPAAEPAAPPAALPPGPTAAPAPEPAALTPAVLEASLTSLSAGERAIAEAVVRQIADCPTTADATAYLHEEARRLLAEGHQGASAFVTAFGQMLELHEQHQCVSAYADLDDEGRRMVEAALEPVHDAPSPAEAAAYLESEAKKIHEIKPRAAALLRSYVDMMKQATSARAA